MIGCSNLAILQEWGDGGPADFAAAFANYDKACERHNGTACAALARFYRQGRGVVSNPGIAAAYVSRACELGHAASCKEAGN